MKKFRLAAVLPLAALLMGADAPPAAAPMQLPAQKPGVLHLTLEGLRSEDGHVRICLWANGQGFPDCKGSDAVERIQAPAASTVTLDVKDLTPGEYGISVIHDENDNKRLDKSFVGLPFEGVGFSNNASAPFGPPKFEKVQFTVAEQARQTIRMRYYL